MTQTHTSKGPTFAQAVRAWAYVGAMSFGGPAAQMALMHRVVVDEKKWLTEEQYLGALSFCMLLPGPEAMQLATYVGWRLHGIAGGLAAGLLFVGPGALVVLCLAGLYAAFGAAPLVETLFIGVKAAVLVIVAEALMKIARRALKTPAHWLLAAGSFIGIFFFNAPFPLLIVGTALIGAFVLPASTSAEAPHAKVAFAQTARTIGLWLAVWLTPLIALTAAIGPEHTLSQIAWFFSKLAVVSFGGAYAVLAYMAQDVVSGYGWLTPGQMLDALGLAETTPGPLILVTEFVAALAAYFNAEGPAWLMGALGALMALWATFAPCFLWIFAGAPYIEWMNSQPRLKSALAGVSAAVVGVMLNLALWFALQALFAQVSEENWGLARLWTPELASLNLDTLIVAGLSAAALWCARAPAPVVLALAALCAVALGRVM